MDEAKNMALLFFMDHLMQKNGRRTIHDLSCQFGARGWVTILSILYGVRYFSSFTEPMRNAVGTTQEGLTDFLQSHPSLFTIEGDQVSSTPILNPILPGKVPILRAKHQQLEQVLISIFSRWSWMDLETWPRKTTRYSNRHQETVTMKRKPLNSLSTSLLNSDRNFRYSMPYLYWNNRNL